HDRYDRYDPLTPPRQRQQRVPPLQHKSDSPKLRHSPSTPSSNRSLRRTPRFHGTPGLESSKHSQRQVHVEAASVGISPKPRFAVAGSPPRQEPQEHRQPRRQLSQALSDDLDDASSFPHSDIPGQARAPDPNRPDPHPFVRISKGTHSAILWALEEALRQPHSFSPDLLEENASMAELLGGGGGPATSNGNGTSASRPTAPVAQTGSPSQGIRGPRMIMRERAEREARQRAEREQMERNRAEEEARLLEEQRQRAAERNRPAAGAGIGGVSGGGGGGGGGGGDIAMDPATQRRQQRAQEAQASGLAGPSRTQPTSTQTQQPLRPTRVPTSQTAPAFGAAPTAAGVPSGSNIQPGEASAAAAATRPRNSFPHAFERWEALSAHWEGMTSFWIRKLQENTEEIDRNPVSSQLSRQVSDLSAAGANLFHAVVELQRLRASSERKFQRWFFETRAQLERNQEVNGQLQSLLDEERRGRADAIRDAVEHERVNSKTQQLVSEMRKELGISKDEARRAWEELGRREQEERERTQSLQQGLPTIVGGVQVVPMTQGVPSRQASTRDPGSHTQGGQSEYAQAQVGRPEYSHDSPTQTASSSAPGTSAATYYQQPETTAPGGGSYGGGSEAGYSEGEYMIDSNGHFVRDIHGDKIPFHSPVSQPGAPSDSDPGAEEYDEGHPSPKASNYPPSSSQWVGTYSGPPEYSGQGYAAPGWETMPRHHHPTRLSDVLEEDERSRTSTSQVSRA
ncbi:hypothetical protein QBC33DRAFT_448516, partial [Phialemonium atrogriseum]